MVSDYGLDERAIGVRSPAGVKDFSSNLCVETTSEALLASHPMGNAGAFPRPERKADHSTHVVPKSRVSRSYNSSSPLHVHNGSRTVFNQNA
jgi:hypothetical protein